MRCGSRRARRSRLRSGSRAASPDTSARAPSTPPTGSMWTTPRSSGSSTGTARSRSTSSTPPKSSSVRRARDPLPSRHMDLGLRGRTAIVCGSSSGLGLAAAEALSEEGANVTMFARRREQLERDADRIGALAVRGDVTNVGDLERLVAKTLEAFGGIDILVWNSGGPPPGKAGDVTDDSLEAAFDLLLAPAVRLVRLCRPHLEESGSGR